MLKRRSPLFACFPFGLVTLLSPAQAREPPAAVVAVAVAERRASAATAAFAVDVFAPIAGFWHYSDLDSQRVDAPDPVCSAVAAFPYFAARLTSVAVFDISDRASHSRCLVVQVSRAWADLSDAPLSLGVHYRALPHSRDGHFLVERYRNVRLAWLPAPRPGLPEDDTVLQLPSL